MNWQERIRPLSADNSAVGAGSSGRTRRAIYVAVAIVAVVLGGLYGFNAFRENAIKKAMSARRPTVTAVNVETVTPQSVSPTITAVGSLAAVHEVTVSAEVSGQVARVLFEGGETVRKGAILVEMNIARERADLVSAQAQEKLTQLALDRARELRTNNNISQAQLDTAQSQYDVARAAVQRADAAIGYKVIRAPFDGVLSPRDVEVGQYLSPGQKITQITDLSQLQIEFTIAEKERPRLKLGQTIELNVDAYPERGFEGKLAVMDPQVDRNARTIKLQAVTSNEEGLLNPGMYANVRLVLAPVPDVLSLPEIAISSSLYGSYVYVVTAAEGKDGKQRLTAKRTIVTPGEQREGRIAIVTGLNPGDRVVTSGVSKISDGAEIMINDQPSLVQPSQISVQ